MTSKARLQKAARQSSQRESFGDEEPTPHAAARHPAPPPPASFEDDPPLTLAEVAERLHVTATTVRKYVEQRMLKAQWRGPRLIVRTSTLMEYMGNNYVPAEKD